jgi:hypothetical protein
VDIRSVDVGAIDGHVNIGGPVIVSPFDIQTVIGLQSGGQRAIVSKRSFPFDRNIAFIIDSGGNAVVVINLLGNSNLLVFSGSSELDIGVIHLVVDLDLLVIRRGSKLNVGLVQAVLDIHFLASGGSSEFDIGVAIVVAEHDIGFLTFHVVTGVDSDTGTVDIDSLGCFNAMDIESGSSRSSQAEGKISSLVIRVQFKLGTTALLGIDFAAKGNSPATSVGACLTPNIAWKRGDVGGGANGGLNSIAEINVAGGGFATPVEGGVQSVKSVKVSITERNLHFKNTVNRFDESKCNKER